MQLLLLCTAIVRITSLSLIIRAIAAPFFRYHEIINAWNSRHNNPVAKL